MKDIISPTEHQMFVGADGCKVGWFAVGLIEETNWKIQVFPDISSLWNQCRDARLILIDVPIGLRNSDSSERRCDKGARKFLGRPRGSSVFRVPCRDAVYAATTEEAKRINTQKTGRSLSVQTLGIIPKIREVDEFLNENNSARSRIREIHPELCFWALNGGNAMLFKKKKIEGLHERMTVLRRACNQTNAILKFARREFGGKVTDDDILDALAAAVTAFLGRQRLVTIPENPEVDTRGLCMEMVYYPVP